LQRCSASAAGTVCRGFQAAAEKADKEAERQQRIAEHEQREQKVCVAFCLQCTGTFVPLAALVCPDLSSAAALSRGSRRCVSRSASSALAPSLALAALVCILVPLFAALLCVCSGNSWPRGFQAAAEKARQFAETEALELTGSELRRKLKEDGLKKQQRAELRRRLRATLKSLAQARQPTRQARALQGSDRQKERWRRERDETRGSAEEINFGPVGPKLGAEVGRLLCALQLPRSGAWFVSERVRR
jgi:hypothetical protein